MKYCRKIELLAPAKNVACGIEAVNHGADAVYIGAPKFGARSAAGNSLDDIRYLVSYAHIFRVKIYVTINTILKDEELEETRKLIWDLYYIGVDALIVQDMALLRMQLPPIPLHASTQMDNRTPEKVAFLQRMGYKQTVLARELSIQQIATIHKHVPDMPLEVFVHGALCVSYSGQCYASQACFGRSANRGECAQFCRLPFKLKDAQGKVLFDDKYLLSLKDMNRSEYLEELLDAGVTSLKIEGRLKDVTYVKNVTAFYRKKLDELFKKRPEYVRASSGSVSLSFTPQLNKSFNRGFTTYFLHGRQEQICSFSTPKSVGEEMGYVKEQRGGAIIMAGTQHFNNGDGACYYDEMGRLQGFRINKVDQNKLYPLERLNLRSRTVLYRNFDQEFEKQLSKESAQRKLNVVLILSEMPDGFLLCLKDEDECSVGVPLRCTKELARSPQYDNYVRQLSKMGNTPFAVQSVDVRLSDNWFIPTSVLNDLRREGVEALLRTRKISYPAELSIPAYRKNNPVDEFIAGQSFSYLANVMNDEAKAEYKALGASFVSPAFEKDGSSAKGNAIMFCRHCIRYMMGACRKQPNAKVTQLQEPLFLESRDGKRFQLEFDCKQCQMNVYEVD